MADFDRTAFSKFIIQEAQKRHVSLREFARQVGVSSATIIRAADPKKAKPPTLDFVQKLARTTGADLCTLLDLIFPGSVGADEDRAFLVRFSQYRRLSPDDQRIIERFLDGALAEIGQKPV